MRITLRHSTVRDFCPDDAPSLALHANNRKVAQNLRDSFPSPYRLEDARRFIAAVLSEVPSCHYAIEVDGAAVGSIGVRPKNDIERVGAEIGYWLGEAYWGRGIVGEIVPAVVEFAVEQFKLIRLEAWVSDGNRASERVLVKAGFECEALCRQSAMKNGQIIDRRLFAYLAPLPAGMRASAAATDSPRTDPELAREND